MLKNSENEYYYIDMDVLGELIKGAPNSGLEEGFINESETTTETDAQGNKHIVVKETKVYKPREVDGLRYEMYTNLIRIVLESVSPAFIGEMTNDDTNLPMQQNEVDSPLVHIVVNTLIKQNIIKKI